MRAVITGGAGFLGSHLCDRFIAEGWDVLSLDNLITGVEANLAHLAKNPKFQSRTTSTFASRFQLMARSTTFCTSHRRRVLSII